MELKRVPLHQLHTRLGAKIVPFAGFEMPVRYSSDIDEHLAVRNAVGIFDVSHMGEFIVKGPKAIDLLQYATSNNVAKLAIGKAQYSCLPNDKGGIVDDILLYRIAENEYFLVVNASNIEKDWRWLNQNNSFGATLENVSDQMCLFAVQGPKAQLTLQKLTPFNLATLPYYTFVANTSLAGVENILISNTGYTGAGGFEIYVPNNQAESIWNAIMEAGQEYDLKPIGLGARDTLRLEKGFCLYGNDIDDTTSPIEAGLGWITSFEKKFINSEELKQQKEKGTSKKLVGFTMIERGIPRNHYQIFNANAEQIGEVTSGSQSPLLNCGIGLGYVKTEYAKPETEIFIGIRENKVKAMVCKTPFV